MGRSGWREAAGGAILAVILVGLATVGGAVAHQVDWPTFGGDPGQERLAPIPQLSPERAARLQPAFSTALPRQQQSQEGFPLEVGGRLYVSTAGAGVVALNATTGQILWSVAAQGTGPNRGVAAAGGRVYVLTSDDHLLALDAADGAPVFAAPVLMPGDDPAYFETTAPVVADGLVVVGVSGGDLGTRGFVEALSAADGHPVWRFYTVPVAGQGWVPADGNHGGGSVWTPVTVDPATGTVFAAVGNPSPDFVGDTRPGADPYTDGVLALDLHTGHLKWFGSEVQHDLWDYDAASPPVLFPLPGGGRGVGEAGKSGYWFEWDAATGRALAGPTAFVKEDHPAPTPAGVLDWPGTWGGANYGPSAYSAALGLAFVSGIEQPQVIRGVDGPHADGAADFGTAMGNAPGYLGTGSITAVAVASGSIRWQVPIARPALGGVTATAGGLVLFGTVGGQIQALDARTGAPVWATDTGANIGTAPIAYEADGHVYVAITTGGGGMSGAARHDAVVAWRLG